MSEPFEIRYADEAVADLKPLRAYDQRKVLAGVETYLRFQPRTVSKSRIKAMTQPYWSQFRLRLDDVRVYYDVSDDPRTVFILRVLEKGPATTPEAPP